MPVGEAKVEAVEEFVRLTITGRDREKFRKFLKDHIAHEIDLTVSVNGRITGTASGGIIEIGDFSECNIKLEKHVEHRTTAQLATLKGIERFIYWAGTGHKPVGGDHDLYWIHEGLIETYSPEAMNEVTNKKEPMRTRDPRFTTKDMARLIEGALGQLCTTDIPKDVLDQIGKDMRTLWTSWYNWRYNLAKSDPLAEFDAAILTWESYRLFHPVCELCGLGETESDPVERMHCVSAGADKSIYELSWNWLAAHHSHHALQHSSGWKQEIYSVYPHIKGKIERARSYAHAKGII